MVSPEEEENQDRALIEFQNPRLGGCPLDEHKRVLVNVSLGRIRLPNGRAEASPFQSLGVWGQGGRREEGQ